MDGEGSVAGLLNRGHSAEMGTVAETEFGSDYHNASIDSVDDEMLYDDADDMEDLEEEDDDDDHEDDEDEDEEDDNGSASTGTTRRRLQKREACRKLRQRRSDERDRLIAEIQALEVENAALRKEVEHGNVAKRMAEDRWKEAKKMYNKRLSELH
jgi:hypothetical protein